MRECAPAGAVLVRGACEGACGDASDEGCACEKRAARWCDGTKSGGGSGKWASGTTTVKSVNGKVVQTVERDK